MNKQIKIKKIRHNPTLQPSCNLNAVFLRHNFKTI